MNRKKRLAHHALVSRISKTGSRSVLSYPFPNLSPDVNLLSDDVISLLADLVRIPSVCGEEGRVAQFIAEWLVKNGLPVEMLEVKPGRPNTLSRVKGSQDGPRLMLNGHMDTVPPGTGWKHDPFGAEIENGRCTAAGRST